MDTHKEAIRKQKADAEAVQDGGFPGLEVIMNGAVERARVLTSKLIEENDPEQMRAIQGELRALRGIIDGYAKWLSIDTK